MSEQYIAQFSTHLKPCDRHTPMMTRNRSLCPIWSCTDQPTMLFTITRHQIADQFSCSIHQTCTKGYIPRSTYYNHDHYLHMHSILNDTKTKSEGLMHCLLCIITPDYPRFPFQPHADHSVEACGSDDLTVRWRTLRATASRGTADARGVPRVTALRMDASLREEGDFRTRARCQT